MRLARVIGTVTLSRGHKSLQGARLKLIVPQSADQLPNAGPSDREALVAYDELGSGHGSLVCFAEGSEASAPFYPDQKPLDAYITALLDSVEIT